MRDVGVFFVLFPVDCFLHSVAQFAVASRDGPLGQVFARLVGAQIDDSVRTGPRALGTIVHFEVDFFADDLFAEVFTRRPAVFGVGRLGRVGVGAFRRFARVQVRKNDQFLLGWTATWLTANRDLVTRGNQLHECTATLQLCNNNNNNDDNNNKFALPFVD